MAGKLHIHVMYLCATLLAIILLVANRGGEAKPILCPRAVHIGHVASRQACAQLCKQRFGALFYGAVLTNKRSGIYGLEKMSLKHLLLCGCNVKKSKGKKCPTDTDSSGSDSGGSFSSGSDGGSSTGSDRYGGSDGSSGRVSSSSGFGGGSSTSGGSSRRTSISVNTYGSSGGNSGRSSSSGYN